ncbi:BspC domain-containing protein [Paraburkholderia sp. SOS3]|jgi:hypothetical protein|uniref:BspC domain-containing protein n=1 Tax=Paraburkholderia sp. SOS3 TaxID=1926494 RepID=UPI000947469D|nr:hypothetical protein [Paraburkholderia sp. SOS3]APR36377.1 hypothetical protein BTO02_14225 [Paraburkholderia sp. SOS3]
MDRTNVPRRLLRLVGRIAVWVTGVALASPTLSLADQLEQHNQLVNQFVNDMHADPLVADCAAHGSFVASTSTAFDRVEFPPTAFDNVHASVTPWNDSFDERKQRVKVESIVTVDGLGIRTNGGDPEELHFRCGYVGAQMLAFSWNDPVPPLRRAARSEAAPGAASAHGRQVARGHASSTKKSTGKASKKGSTKKGAKSAAKSGSAKSGTTKSSAKSGARSTAKATNKTPATKSTATHKTPSTAKKKKH